MTGLSLVTMGNALHFDTRAPNFGTQEYIQEYMRHTLETDAVFQRDFRFEAAESFVGDIFGHGVDIDEDLAAKYLYKPAYLPVARLEDVTMWNW
jgi:mannonate dehydratase